MSIAIRSRFLLCKCLTKEITQKKEIDKNRRNSKRSKRKKNDRRREVPNCRLLNCEHYLCPERRISVFPSGRSSSAARTPFDCVNCPNNSTHLTQTPPPVNIMRAKVHYYLLYEYSYLEHIFDASTVGGRVDE